MTGAPVGTSSSARQPTQIRGHDAAAVLADREALHVASSEGASRVSLTRSWARLRRLTGKAKGRYVVSLHTVKTRELRREIAGLNRLWRERSIS